MAASITAAHAGRDRQRTADQAQQRISVRLIHRNQRRVRMTPGSASGAFAAMGVGTTAAAPTLARKRAELAELKKLL